MAFAGLKGEDLDRRVRKIRIFEKSVRETKKELFNIIARLENVEGRLDELLKQKSAADGPVIPLDQLLKWMKFNTIAWESLENNV